MDSQQSHRQIASKKQPLSKISPPPPISKLSSNFLVLPDLGNRSIVSVKGKKEN